MSRPDVTGELIEDEIDVGSVLRDTYEITGVLGKGGMGTVYLARHVRLPGKQVAVKVLQVSIASEEIHSRFRREAEIVARLGHPNIVEVLDFNTLEHGTPYLVLEYLRGESLHRRLKRGPLELDLAFGLIRQVGSALHSAHKAGVVHRDLKPDNIFLTPTDTGGVVGERVKLLDFGISKMADSDSSLKTRDAVLIGTPQYMAPEQALGKNSSIDARTDVFALGCIVYEMLSGKGPFAGELIAEVVYRVVHEQPTPLGELCPKLTPTVVKAVERAMRKDPAARYATVAEFVTELTGSPLKSLSSPSVPVAPAAPIEPLPPSGISLDATVARPSKLSTTDGRPPKPASRPFAVPRRRNKGPWIALAIGIGTLAGVSFALAYRWRQDAAPAPPIPLDAPGAAPVLPQGPPPGPEAKAVAPPLPAPHGPVPAPELPLPAEVASDLAAGEQALGRGDASEAIRLAQHSQRLTVTGAAYSLLVRAHCQQGDLSNARAQWSNVQGRERRAVQSFCKSHGIEL